MRFTHSPANSVVIAVTAFMAALTLQPMLADGAYLSWVGLVAATSGIVGALGALARAPRMVTILLQLLAMLALLVWNGLERAATLPGTEGTGPIGSLVALARSGSTTVREGALPLPSETGLLWLIAAILALVTITLELLVNGLEQPAWAMAPLSVLYGIGALALPGEMSWKHFALVAIGYVAILLVTTGFGSGRRAGSRAQVGQFQASRVAVGVTLALVAALLALLVTPSVPMGPKQPWLEAGQDAPIQLSDPTIKLNENLNRPQETDVLTYRTADGRPTYLRTVALTRLTTGGAQLVPMQLETSGLPDLTNVPGERVEVEVEMDFASEYLPVPFAVESFSADGRWAHDPNTLAVVATGDDRLNQTVALRYTARANAPTPSIEEVSVAAAGADPAGGETLRVPEGLDAAVTTLTQEITAGAADDGARALAIQSFLRSEAFEYSMEAPQSTDLDTISNFLLTDRFGYCIHFAAGMVTMSRIAGIPARMAVGFTPGEQNEDGSFTVTTHNMHTWPELYFEGLGWVPFEPTKSVASPPEYTNPDVAPTAEPTVEPSPSPSPTSQETDFPEVTPTPTGPDGQGSVEEPGSLVGLWIALAVVLVAALPFLVRTGLRWWRLRDGQDPSEAAAAAWDEVRATFIDLGIDWDDHTPTIAAAAMTKDMPLSSAPVLATIAATVERARFSRGGADVSGLVEQVRTLRKDLVAVQPSGSHARSVFLPASLLPNRSGT